MKKKNIVTLSSFIGLTLLVAGCGQTATPPTVSYPNVSSPNGGTTIGTFASGVCYGSIITASDGSQLCKTITNLSGVRQYGVPVLRSNDPVDSRAWTITQVKAGDRIRFSGSGGLGTPNIQQKSLRGGFINFTYGTTQCVAYPLSNIESGLYGSDGTSTFLLGNSANRVIEHDGTLRIGFNDAELYGSPATCWSLMVSQFTLEHCENKAGQTVQCP